MAMQSRRDLYQAHRLMTQRASLALLRGEPDVPDQPLRRINVGTFSGILVAVIVAGIFGIWGLLFHSSSSLKSLQGSLIVDKQTGQNFVFCKNGRENPGGKQVCPVINHASALLALANPGAAVQSVNQSSLVGWPEGPTLGIVSLPDLPTAGLLFQQPWSACTRTQSGVASGQGGMKTTTVLAGDFQPGGKALGSAGLLLVQDSSGQEWVVGNSQRWPVATGTAQTLFNTSPVPVSMTWLNALGQGAPFQAPAIPGQGKTVLGPAGAPVKVGSLFQAAVGGQTEYYVVQHDGKLAPVTQTQEALLALQTQSGSSPPTLSPAQVNGKVAPKLPDDGLPATETGLVSRVQSDPLCVVLSGSGSRPAMQVEVGGTMPSGARTGAPAGSGLADEVDLPPGKGALVAETGSTVSYLLVTNDHRYAMASKAVPGYLGYSLSQAVHIPAGFADMIPPGPGLSPAQAAQPVSDGSPGTGGA